jgi:hypothetical protein
MSRARIDAHSVHTGKMAGGLDTAWRFFGQLLLPHLLSRPVRLTTDGRLTDCSPERNAMGSEPACCHPLQAEHVNLQGVTAAYDKPVMFNLERRK